MICYFFKFVNHLKLFEFGIGWCHTCMTNAVQGNMSSKYEDSTNGVCDQQVLYFKGLFFSLCLTHICIYEYKINKKQRFLTEQQYFGIAAGKITLIVFTTGLVSKYPLRNISNQNINWPKSSKHYSVRGWKRKSFEFKLISDHPSI